MAALFRDGHRPSGDIDIARIQSHHGRPTHAGLDQQIDDGPVPPGPIALAPRSLVGKLGLEPPVARAPANDRQVIGHIEELAPLGRRDRPLDLEAGAR